MAVVAETLLAPQEHHLSQLLGEPLSPMGNVMARDKLIMTLQVPLSLTQHQVLICEVLSLEGSKLAIRN